MRYPVMSMAWVALKEGVKAKVVYSSSKAKLGMRFATPMRKWTFIELLGT